MQARHNKKGRLLTIGFEINKLFIHYFEHLDQSGLRNNFALHLSMYTLLFEAYLLL